MENTTNNSFEEQWQRAFDDASLPPSEAVWEKVELCLGNQNIPPKSGNGLYYVGAISAVILGVVLWFILSKKESVKRIQVVENKIVVSKKIVPKEEKIIVKSKEKTVIKKTFIPEKEEVIELINDPESVTIEPQNQERIIIDSIDFMSPIILTQKVNSESLNPTINIPLERTPYYEIPKPKSKKKSIWEKVKVSGGVGIYQ